MATGTYFYGLGRRKSATATARLYEGKGEVTINGKSAGDIMLPWWQKLPIQSP